MQLRRTIVLNEYSQSQIRQISYILSGMCQLIYNKRKCKYEIDILGLLLLSHATVFHLLNNTTNTVDDTGEEEDV